MPLRSASKLLRSNDVKVGKIKWKGVFYEKRFSEKKI